MNSCYECLNDSSWFESILVEPVETPKMRSFNPDFHIARYFEPAYVVNFADIKNNDFAIYQHPNSICVLSFAPTHFVFNIKDFKGLDFKVDIDSVRSLKGKHKRGAHIFHQPDTPIASIDIGDQNTFSVPCLIPGLLYEVNSKLSSKQFKNDLAFKHDPKNFIAILMPRYRKLEKMASNCSCEKKSSLFHLLTCVNELKFLNRTQYEDLTLE